MPDNKKQKEHIRQQIEAAKGMIEINSPISYEEKLIQQTIGDYRKKLNKRSEREFLKFTEKE